VKNRPATVRDERGMILIVALPMALLVLGCLCYLVSVGDGVVYRERLQDTADATAWQSAVLHARGMNAVALLNGLLAALSSITGMLTAVQALALASTALLGSSPAWLQSALDARQELTPRIDSITMIVAEAQLAVAETSPRLAIERASADNTAFYRAQGAAISSIALSHAALPRSEQTALAVDPAHAWRLTSAKARAALPGSQDGRSAPSEAGRLPFERETVGACERELGRAELLELVSAVSRRRDVAAQALALSEQLGRPLGAAVSSEQCAAFRPLALGREAQNGNVMLQTWSIARGLPQAHAATGLRVASWARPVTLHPAPDACAQAEFYFDCAGTWQQCQPDAAWSARWSARLRRFHKPASGAQTARVAAAFEREAQHLQAGLRPFVSALFEGPESRSH
jgi:hypothetical protein